MKPEQPMNRREFLRGSAAAAALPLLGGVTPRSNEHGSPEALYRWAMDHLRAGRCYQRSTELLERAVAARPGEPRYRTALGCAYLDRALEIYTWRMKREMGSAHPSLASSQQTGPEQSPEALDAEAREAARKALAELREAARLAPADPEIQHTLGWVLTIAGWAGGSSQAPDVKREAAVEAFETALRLSPGEARYHHAMGDALRCAAPPGASALAWLPPDMRHLLPEPSPEERDRWARARRRMLEAYRRAAELRPSDGFLPYVLYGLSTDGSPGQWMEPLEHLAAAQRLLPSNAMLSYELASCRYRAAAEVVERSDSRKRDEAEALKDRALQALQEANDTETMSFLWACPEYPPLLAAELRRLPLQDFTARMEVETHLRSLARDAVAHGEERRKSGDRRGAVGIFEEVVRLGERLIGDPGTVGPPENYVVEEKLVGIAIARVALKPLKRLAEELGDRDIIRRVEAQEAKFQLAHGTANADIQARYEAGGGNWDEDLRAAQAQVAAQIQARKQAEEEQDGQA